MKVIIASHNPAKIAAVKEAFETVFSNVRPEFLSVNVPSGVSDQPLSDSETFSGARNRALNARSAFADADYWVGLEGGLEQVDEQLLASAWMVIAGPGGRIGQARTPTLPIPPGVRRLIDSGLELGEANDRVFATHNSKQAGGAFGLLTDGRLTRGGIYAQALELALIPLTHNLWDGQGS